MKTVLITDDSPVPAALRELIERGSTSLVEQRAAEIGDEAARSDAAAGVDRIVFWSASDDETVRKAAERFAAAEAVERREMVVFVTSEDGGAQASPRLGPNEVFVWPRDEDRLQMAFLTGA